MDKYNESYPLMVSIKCLAYNHEKFIRETLEGFVMQKTNFRFEAIVHDDASTDGTTEIIREYAEKYPDIIKPIYETENQYSKKDGSLTRIMHEACKGKYIAICEGDDYWTDPYKLQKQVDFLENHSDYVICSHRYNVYLQNKISFSNKILPILDYNDSITYTLNDLINGKWLAHPLTVVYRSSALDFNTYMKFKMKQDVVLFYLLLKRGKGFLMPDTMAVYRVHDGGVWSHFKKQEKYIFELKQRLAIYEVERTSFAADFIFRTIESRPISRMLLLKEYNIFVKIVVVLCKHKGVIFTLGFLFKRFFR